MAEIRSFFKNKFTGHNVIEHSGEYENQAIKNRHTNLLAHEKPSQNHPIATKLHSNHRFVSRQPQIDETLRFQSTIRQVSILAQSYCLKFYHSSKYPKHESFRKVLRYMFRERHELFLRTVLAEQR